jgi:hypothetical protein
MASGAGGIILNFGNTFEPSTKAERQYFKFPTCHKPCSLAEILKTPFTIVIKLEIK